MNKESTFKRRCIGFTKVSHTITRNTELSLPAIGLITKLLSNKDGFAIHKETEQKRSGMGEKRFNQAWGELEANGFIKSEKIRNQFLVWHYTIVNDPNIDDEVVPEVQAPLDYPQESTPEKQGVKNQPLLSRAGKVGDNIDVSKIELKNLDISNKEEKNVNEINIGKIEIPGDLPINDESVDGIITSGSTVNQNGTLILDNNATDSLNNNSSNNEDLTLENFIRNTSIEKLNESDFEEEISYRKNLFLNYWYNKIDSTPINTENLLVLNDNFYFRCFNFTLKNCIMFGKGMQPENFLDTTINRFLHYSKFAHQCVQDERENRHIHPIEVASYVLYGLICNTNKLSAELGLNK